MSAADPAGGHGELPVRCALAFVSGFALGYLLPATLRLPTVAYDPVRRAFSWERVISGVQMRYFNDLFVACCSGALAALFTRWRRKRGDLAIAAGVALSLVALDLSYYLSRLLAAR